MKKYLCITIVLLMLAGNLCMTSAVYADNSLSYETAAAYKAVIDDSIAKYGTYTISDGMYSGVGLIQLIDFDGNGTKELLIGVTEVYPDKTGDCFYEVYGYDNGAFMLTHTPCSDSFQLCFSLSFAECDGKVYATTWLDTICDGTAYYGTVSDNKWVTTEFYEHWGDAPCYADFHPENPGLVGSDVYAINEKPVSEDEYNKQMSEFKSVSYDEYGEKGTEKALKEIESVINSETASSVSLIERIKTSYAQILNTVSADAAQNFEDPCYYVYDINKDNLPELIIKRGTCEADYRYDVYTYTDYEAVYIGKLPGGHISVCGINESGILLYHAHMGYEMIFEGTMDSNKISYKTIYEEDCSSKEYEYDGNIGKFREGAGYLQRCPSLNDYSLLNQYFEAVPVSEDISVKINGEKIVLEQLPIMINDRTLIPFRAVFEALGADVTWDENTNSAVGSLDGKKVEFPVGQSIYYVDGEKHEMDTETYINEVQGRTYIPVRYAAESFGFSVEWIENKRLIEIQK